MSFKQAYPPAVIQLNQVNAKIAIERFIPVIPSCGQTITDLAIIKKRERILCKMLTAIEASNWVSSVIFLNSLLKNNELEKYDVYGNKYLCLRAKSLNTIRTYINMRYKQKYGIENFIDPLDL
jgi:hypothetical protein